MFPVAPSTTLPIFSPQLARILRIFPRENQIRAEVLLTFYHKVQFSVTAREPQFTCLFNMLSSAECASNWQDNVSRSSRHDIRVATQDT